MENNPPFLKKSSEYSKIKEHGQRYWVTKWLLFNYISSDDVPGLRLGVTASRKVGSAVVRNRLKRWTREYMRSLPDSVKDSKLEINIIFKPIDTGFYKGLSYSEYSKSLDRGLKYLIKSS